MKHIITYIICSLFLFSPELKAQVKPGGSETVPTESVRTIPGAYVDTTHLNTIITWIPSMPTADPDKVIAVSRRTREIVQSTQYMDGLGRTIQTVTRKTVHNKDMVAPVLYDALGRQSVAYLAYTSPDTTGSFKYDPFQEQSAFMTRYHSGEQFFYGMNQYETSPSGRIVASYAPGNSWIGSNRSANMDYEFNHANEVRIWTIDTTDGAVPISSGYYAAGTLYKLNTINEDGKYTVEYKDLQQKTILKKVQLAGNDTRSHDGWLCNYYIYDELNALRFIIPPKAVEFIAGHSWDLTYNAAIISEMCFWYAYDKRGRVRVKKVPGADTAKMVYDALDRLVMTQNGNLYSKGKWMVTTYDVFNRPLQTVLWSNVQRRSLHEQSAQNSSTYPNLTGTTELLTQTYYDNYSWVSGTGSGLSSTFSSTGVSTEFLAASDDVFPYPQSLTPTYSIKGMIAGSKVKVLGTSTYLYAVNFYDTKGRPIQVLSTNFKGGTDYLTTQYSFDGKALVSRNLNNTTALLPQTISVTTLNTYNESGQVDSVFQRINGGDKKLVVRVNYDSVGNLMVKNLGKSPSSAEPLDSLVYAYNIRGWLKSINKGYLEGSADNWFGMEIAYDQGFTTNQYNGNISGIKWRDGNDDEMRAYGYSYDAVNRLLKADFTQQNGGWNTSAGRDFTTIIGNGIHGDSAYDANGNIRKMIHYNTPSNKIDDLTYNYNHVVSGNKLWRVTDAENDLSSTLGDFKEITSGQSQDYWYDANGNMTKDENKGISNITYNHLNLPDTITVSGKGTIVFIYDAVGNKIAKEITESSSVNTYLYNTIYQYKNDTLFQFSHQEGRVRRKPIGDFVYDYYLKDHLGSVRVTLTEEEEVEAYSIAGMEPDKNTQETQYYYNISETRFPKPSAYLQKDSTDKYAARLDGKVKKVGPAIILKVMAGDRLNIRTDSWYENKNRKNSPVIEPLEAMAAGMLGGAGEAVGKALGAAGQGLNPLLPAITTLLRSKDAEDKNNLTKPKAYLNWILLDEQLKPIVDSSKKSREQNEYSGFIRVGQPGDLKKLIKQDWKIAKGGYVYIYTSNESQDADVFFDNFSITSFSGPLLETNHTYPFGLTIRDISITAPGKLKNKYKFNGKEEQENEWLDESGLKWLDFGARVQDPQLGRFLNIDPKCEIFSSYAPYNYCFNNPMLFIDPDGMAARWNGLYGPASGYVDESGADVDWYDVQKEYGFGTFANSTTAMVFSKNKANSQNQLMGDNNGSVLFDILQQARQLPMGHVAILQVTGAEDAADQIEALSTSLSTLWFISHGDSQTGGNHRAYFAIGSQNIHIEDVASSVAFSRIAAKLIATPGPLPSAAEVIIFACGSGGEENGGKELLNALSKKLSATVYGPQGLGIGSRVWGGDPANQRSSVNGHNGDGFKSAKKNHGNFTKAYQSGNSSRVETIKNVYFDAFGRIHYTK